ncbi:MAG: hypothetical protein JNJ61_25435, partial [Anaerolineae bacterium]|nr:hypothetical protein [Anaerolineae bacterium]
MMRLFSTWGIRRRLVYLILTIATLTVLAVSVIALSTSASILRRQTEDAYVNRNQAFAGALDTRLQNAAVTARALAAAISDPQRPPLDVLWPMISGILADP